MNILSPWPKQFSCTTENKRPMNISAQKLIAAVFSRKGIYTDSTIPVCEQLRWAGLLLLSFTRSARTHTYSRAHRWIKVWRCARRDELRVMPEITQHQKTLAARALSAHTDTHMAVEKMRRRSTTDGIITHTASTLWKFPCPRRDALFIFPFIMVKCWAAVQYRF